MPCLTSANMNRPLAKHRQEAGLYDHIHDKARDQGKGHHEGNVQGEAFCAQHDLQSAQIGDLGGRAGEHEGRRAAHAHAHGQPLPDEGYRPAAAGVQRHPDGGRHQHPKALIGLAEQRRELVRRDIPLKERRQQHPQQEVKPRGPDVPAQVEEEPQQRIRVRVMAGPRFKAVEAEKGPVLIKPVDHQPRHDAADRTGHQADDERRGAKGGAVHDELGV